MRYLALPIEDESPTCVLVATDTAFGCTGYVGMKSKFETCAQPIRFTAIGLRCAVASAAVVLVGMLFEPIPAQALPAYARQTGQPCATCHNGAFPQLTSYGREFKINGYVSGGRTCSFDRSAAAYAANAEPVIPLSAMVVGTFTHTQADQESLPTNRKGDLNGLGVNDNWMAQDSSVFLAGQIVCNIGAFMQATYDRNDQAFFLDNTDFRMTDRRRIGDVDSVFGLTVNNNPSVEDPWNTTPAWRIPGGGSITSAFAPGTAAPMVDSLGGVVAGVGAYAWLNNSLYVSLSNYRVLDDKTLQALGEGPPPGFQFDGPAPYWRVALEKNWGDFSLMVGTYGMHASVIPDETQQSPNDSFTDIGYDTQFQYLRGKHFFTGRISYETENSTLTGSQFLGNSDNTKDWLHQFNISGTYAYDSTYSATLGYFDTRGSTDHQLYAVTAGLPTVGGSPNTRGEFLELGYSPFSKGGPRIYPWFNTRIGLQYWHYDQINGGSINYDGAGRNASGDNTVILYSWTAF